MEIPPSAIYSSASFPVTSSPEMTRHLGPSLALDINSLESLGRFRNPVEKMDLPTVERETPSATLRTMQQLDTRIPEANTPSPLQSYEHKIAADAIRCFDRQRNNSTHTP